jgi:hypothetical protein
MSVFVSDADLIRSGHIVRAWDFTEFKKATVTGSKAHETYREFDCRKWSSKIISMKVYDKNNKLMDNYGFLPDWHSTPKAGTMAHELIKLYCE